MSINLQERMHRISNIYTNLSAPMKASIWFTICNIFQKGISTITVPIFTRILTPAQYGVFSVYQSWYSIIIIFATLDLFYGVFNNGMIKYENDRNGFLLSMQSLATLITFILLLVYLIAPNWWSGVLGMPVRFINVMFLELFFSPALAFWAGKQRFTYKYRALVTITVIQAIVTPIFGIIAVLGSDDKAFARVFSFVLVEVIIGGGLYCLNLKNGQKVYNWSYWKYALKFNIPLIPHYLSQIVLQQSDRIMISILIGNAEAAIYSVVYNISILISLFTNAIFNSYTPYTYESLKSKNYNQLRRNTNILIALIGVLSLFVMLIGPELVHLFAPPKYYKAISIIPPVTASLFFSFLYPIFGNVEFYFEKNQFVVLASTVGAILNIGLNFILLPIFGYVAAGYTTLACYMIFSGAHYGFMKLILKQQGINQVVYDGKIIGLISVFVLIASAVSLILYNYLVIRIVLIFSFIISFFLNSKKILRLLRQVIRK